MNQSSPLPSTTTPSAATTPSASRLLRWLLTLGLIAFALIAILGDAVRSGTGLAFIGQRFQTFATIFLRIFIEATPFLLAGSIVSGLLAVFVDQAMIARFAPRQPLLAALAGACMGLIFPVCECGVVPVTRRLYEKGLPMSVGIAFLLTAPVINPVVIFSTWSAFGFGEILLARIAFSFLVALLVGLVFQFAKPQEILLPEVCGHFHEHGPSRGTWSSRFQQSLTTAGDDFLDMARYLIIGSMLAASMQTLVPQSALLSIGQGPVLSVIAMQALAFVLSICSTVDSFVALAFVNSFTTGSVLSFLVFGPMVDIKSSLMFLGVFQRRVVAYLIVLPLLMTLLMGIAWNFYVR